MYDLIKGGALDAELVAANMGAAAITGARRSMKNVSRRHILLAMEAGLSAETPTIVLEQSKDAAGDGEKVLNLTKVYVKVGTGAWTEVDGISRKSPAASYDSSAASDGTNAIQICAVVDAETLDDGFTHVRINSAAVTGDRRGTVFHAVGERAYQGEPDTE